MIIIEAFIDNRIDPDFEELDDTNSTRLNIVSFNYGNSFCTNIFDFGVENNEHCSLECYMPNGNKSIYRSPVIYVRIKKSEEIGLDIWNVRTAFELTSYDYETHKITYELRTYDIDRIATNAPIVRNGIIANYYPNTIFSILFGLYRDKLRDDNKIWFNIPDGLNQTLINYYLYDGDRLTQLNQICRDFGLHIYVTTSGLGIPVLVIMLLTKAVPKLYA